MASRFRSCAVCLLDRLDRKRERAGGNADRDAVALLLAHQRATDGRVDGDSAGGRIALDRAHQVVGLCLAVGVDDVDGRTRSGDARVRLLDDLRPPDHLLELIDAAVEEADLLLRLLVFRVVFDVARLERLLQARARLGTPLQRDLEIALELLQPGGREQYRYGQVHLRSEMIPVNWTPLT